MIAGGQQMLRQLPERSPAFVTQEQIADLMVSLRSNVTALGHNLVSLSLNTLAGVFTVVLYVVLLPMLVFFLLMDKRLILVWISRLLPRERSLATGVWREVDQQLGNYVRGKFVETVNVGVATYIVFALMGLHSQCLRRIVLEPRAFAAAQGDVAAVLPELEAIYHVGEPRGGLGEIGRVDLAHVAERLRLGGGAAPTAAFIAREHLEIVHERAHPWHHFFFFGAGQKANVLAHRHGRAGHDDLLIPAFV